jgi:hypothetical protein
MNQHTTQLAHYWRTSLADAENGNGALTSRQVDKFVALPIEALLAGCVDEALAHALFRDEPVEMTSVAVTLRPFVFKPRLQHGQVPRGIPTIVTPLVGRVDVTRDGRLYPTQQLLIARDLLEPLDRGSFVIGEQVELDRFLSAQQVPVWAMPGEDEAPCDVDEHQAQWTEYLDFCTRLLGQVASDWLSLDTGFERAAVGYLFKEDKPQGFSRHIVGLYDHLRSARPSVPLFERFAQREQCADEPCLPAHSQFATRLAHAGDEFALAPAQRDALAHVMVGAAGDVLAINGPPGTGKTTLLLSVVASLWARAALAGGEPPVIVASSTNNQAVTNIIKAFGKDFSPGHGPLAGRWLPDIDSFGAYFPSASAEAEMARSYQTRSFFAELERESYLDKARQTYLQRAAVAFPSDCGSVQTVVAKLQACLREREQQLCGIEATWTHLDAARLAVRQLLGAAPPAGMAALQARFDAAAGQAEQAQAHQQHFKRYLAHEPLLYTLFAWLAPVAGKRLRLAKLHLEESGADSSLQAATSVSDIENRLEAGLAQARAAVRDLAAQVQAAEHLLQAEQQRLQAWADCLAAMPPLAERPADGVHLRDCDTWADTTLRFEIFLLTTHYWEGRWLLEVAETLPEILASRKRTGLKTLVKNWQRWMKLTPCVVSTFFMLPEHLRGTRREGADWVDNYALNFIDLLIVDEAGQVLPEVAAPSFALARQALVIGDTLQIEPIWAIPAAVDIGNLMAAGVLGHPALDDDYQAFCAGGHSAANGSVMAVAQHTSRYHYDPDMARGMFLYEHRRCFDSIIEYCNALCYKGKLQPRRGPAKSGGLPALGYLHVDGLCQQGNGGSRHNLLEAQTIAAWIAANAADLLARYEHKLALWQILGVITPFGAQTQAIGQACAALGIKTGKADGEITVGTVHSFQGAERPVIIFSAVYSKHADGAFIDHRDSMLNVAVSRAKDSFLVFGDMDLFGQVPPGKPRGKLAQFLLADPASELSFDYQPRQDLHTARTGLQHLHQAPEHDRFLAETLRAARRQVQIVTPWLKLRWIEESGAMAEMAASVARGVQVTVYTDYEFNAQVSREQPLGDPARIADFNAAIAALRALDIQAYEVRKVHSKIVMADEQLLCIGSFNWLSASRAAQYMNYETSMVYRGPDVTPELATHRASLATRLLVKQAGH